MRVKFFSKNELQTKMTLTTSSLDRNSSKVHCKLYYFLLTLLSACKLSATFASTGTRKRLKLENIHHSRYNHSSSYRSGAVHKHIYTINNEVELLPCCPIGRTRLRIRALAGERQKQPYQWSRYGKFFDGPLDRIYQRNMQWRFFLVQL